ncbi:570_t:CDS:2, partial [Gigaspora rosea]
MNDSGNIEKANFWFLEERKRFHEIIKTEYKNYDIDKDIKILLDDNRYQLSWFPYEFENIEWIGRGGFAEIFKARLSISYNQDKHELETVTKKFWVALKEFQNNEYLGQNLGKLQTRKMKGLKRMTEDDQTEDWS